MREIILFLLVTVASKVKNKYINRTLTKKNNRNLRNFIQILSPRVIPGCPVGHSEPGAPESNSTSKSWPN